MRKYQQLLLVLVSFVSVCTLLLYRYEYLKLLNVLEVLNFFGYADDNLTNCVLLDDRFRAGLENDNRLAKAPASWAQYDGHYAFSAFWNAERRSVSLSLLGPVSAFSGYECRVWFRLAERYTSKPAKLSYSTPRLDSTAANLTNGLHRYDVHCKPDDVPADTDPHAVLLGRPDTRKLFVPVQVPDVSEVRDDLIVCIAPDYTGAPDSHLVEFVAYHTLLGVRHFVAYDIGIHYRVMEFLRSVAGGRNMYDSFSTLSWQYPVADLQSETSMLQSDCLQRTRGRAKHSILLSLDQYLVLDVNEPLSSLSPNVGYTFQVKKCCTNRWLKKSWPMAMRKTLCEGINETVNFVVDEAETNYKKPFTALGSIHKLEEVCEKPNIGKDDKSMAKYLIDFHNSKLLSLWKSQLKYSIIRQTNNNVINL